ncbi:MAG: phage tail tape measure protein, partial [Lachnospiraceae bacterium]|nr:phage tail tape measure protein [Lachnospiraceae bacterium]
LEASKKKYGENSNETLKWQQAVNNAQAELADLQAELQKTSGPSGLGALGQALQETGGKLEEIGGKVTQVGEGLTKSVTAPIVGVGAAALKAFSEVDKGADAIVRKTGATGEQLEAMQTSMENLATSMPTTFEEAGNAIGEVNTRFGVTGEQLETLSGQFLKFAQLNGTDVSGSIDKVQTVMSAFNLDVEDAGAVLDTLNKVAQDTGINVDTLASGLVTNGAALRGLNLDAAQSATLLGQLEKSGIDTSAVMTGLAKVQANAFKEGIDMSTALETAVSSSGDAIDIFGAKAGPRLYEAFQSGILTMDMFTGSAVSLEDNLGNVSDTFDATLSPMDQWKLTLNEIMLAGAELGNAVGPVLVPIIQGLAEGAKSAAEWFGNLDEGQQKTIVTIGGIVAAIGPAITIVGKMITTVGTITKAVGVITPMLGGLGTAFSALTGPIGLAIAAGVLIIANWDKIKTVAGNVASGIASAWNTVSTTTSTVWNAVSTKIGSAMNGAKDKVKTAIDKIKGFFNFKWKLPDLKLPHIEITGSFKLNPPSAPKFSINWYRKAYDNAYGFSRPTVIPTASGMLGFGDGPGTEIVIGQNTLMRTIGTAVQSAMGYFPAGGGSSTSNTFGDTIINVYGAPGQDIEELADIIEDRINAKVAREEAVYA